MRWPGTIQPSRFLSHTGQIMPGVRQVVTTGKPVAGAGWSVVVPAGVMWWVIAARFYMTTSATVASRYAYLSVAVDGTTVWDGAAELAQVASTTILYSFSSTVSYQPVTTSTNSSLVPFPDVLLPQGGVITGNIYNIDAADQVSAASLYIEEYFFTDAQLSEDARLHAELEHDIAVYEYQQATQGQQGA